MTLGVPSMPNGLSTRLSTSPPRTVESTCSGSSTCGHQRSIAFIERSTNDRASPSRIPIVSETTVPLRAELSVTSYV